MGRRNAILFAALLAVSAPLAFSALLDKDIGLRGGATAHSSDYVADELLIRFRPAVSASARAQALAAFGDRPLKRAVGSAGYTLVRLAPGRRVPEAVATYGALSEVESVQPNYRFRYLAAPNDTLYSQLWGLRNTAQIVEAVAGTAGADMDMEEAWDHATDCSPVVVAVLDSGVNYTHEDLAANMWTGNVNHGFDVEENDDDPIPSDAYAHGTHVAGTIAAVGNNGVGSTGVCWSASIMAVRLAGANGLTLARVIDGMRVAVDNGARILNMSLGGPGGPALEAEVLHARNNGVLIVASAGNEGTNNDQIPLYPCNFPHDNVICVAALDNRYNRASFTNYGAASVDVGAPGVGILSAWPGATLTDDFSGWTRNGAWSATTCYTGGPPLLVNPSNWCFLGSTYANGAADVAYRTFDLTGLTGINGSVSFVTVFEMAANDFFSFARRIGGGNPFDVGGTVLLHQSGSGSGEITNDLSPCFGAICSFGFRLTSDGSGVSGGVAAGYFEINATQANSNVYNVMSGTSMAAPHVTGLAALVWAFNPDYTFQDVANSVKYGGDSIAALVGRTVTGRAVNAMGSLRYISAPAGVTATVTILP